MEGAIFKIWGRSCRAIEWCSFMPKEREFLFLPGTRFRVRAWYPATQLNMRRGMRAEGESDEFKLRGDHLVQPVPLQVVDSDVELRKQLVHNKVVVFEMEEVAPGSEDDETIEFEAEARSEEDMLAQAEKFKAMS